MSKWPTRTLGEICEINPKHNGAERLSPEADVSFVPMAAIDEVSATIRLPEIRVLEDCYSGYTPFRENDVLFAKITPCMENGKAAIARDLVGGCGFGSTEFHVLRPKPGLLPEWIFAFVRQSAFRQAAKASFTGTAGQQRVPVEFVKDVRVPVPPLREQERLVRILNEAEALRSLRIQADERACRIEQSLFQEMFGNPSLNPKGWPMTRVGDLISLCEYGTSKRASDTGAGIPMLRMNNVNSDGILDLSDLKSVEVDADELEKYRLSAGDILFNRTNSRELVGKTGMWDGRFDAVAASYFIRIRFDQSREHPQHFTTFMNLPIMKRRLMEMARGAIGQANINAQELKSIGFPIPPIELQYEFAARMAETRALQGAQDANRRQLNDLFLSLLHHAFQGEL